LAASALLFAVAGIIQEWVRGWIFTGFPWKPMATVWAGSAPPVGLPVRQAASGVGTFGAGLSTVAAAALASVVGPAPRWRLAWLWTGAPLVLLVVIGAAGAARLALAPAAYVPDVNLRLVQPNIPQADKWRAGLREKHLVDYVEMSRAD